jgi:RNA polymerase sigma factor (sigma-70 family)
MISMSDLELLNMIQNPSTREKGYRFLVEMYQRRIYGVIRKMVIIHEDADDITQNTFVKAFKNINNFHGNSSLFTWLYRIATNETITFLNKKKKRFFIPWHDIEKVLGDKLESDRYFNADEIQKKLQKAILSLPEKQRIVFNLRYYDEMKYEEMSEILDTSVGALKASYHHAVKKVEEHLKNN